MQATLSLFIAVADDLVQVLVTLARGGSLGAREGHILLAPLEQAASRGGDPHQAVVEVVRRTFAPAVQTASSAVPIWRVLNGLTQAVGAGTVGPSMEFVPRPHAHAQLRAFAEGLIHESVSLVTP